MSSEKAIATEMELATPEIQPRYVEEVGALSWINADLNRYSPYL